MFLVFLVQEAEVGNNSVPEPFDVRTEHTVEARALNYDEVAEVRTELGVPNGKQYIEFFFVIVHVYHCTCSNTHVDSAVSC